MSTKDITKSPIWPIADRLVSFNTVTELSNAECAQYISDYLKSAGFRVETLTEDMDGVEKVQIVATAGPAVEGGLMICGHMDTVPFADQSGWLTNPLELTIDEDRLIGRGINDMKGFVTLCLALAQEIDASKLKKPLVLVFTCDEESGSQGANRLMRRFRDMLGDVPQPKMGWIGEPSNFKIFNAHKGYGYFRLTVVGKSGHSSRPDLGANSITAMGDALRLIESLNTEYRAKVSPTARELFPDFPFECYNPASIQGGLAHNIIPNYCELIVSFRSLPGSPPDALMQTLLTRLDRQVTPNLHRRSMSVEFHCDDVQLAPAMMSPQEGPLPEALIKATGRKVAGGAPYVTDAGYFSQNGMDCYICGPGYLEQAHIPNESLPVTHLFRGMEVLQKVVADLCI